MVVFVDWWWCLLIGGDGQWLFLKCCDFGLTSRFFLFFFSSVCLACSDTT